MPELSFNARVGIFVIVVIVFIIIISICIYVVVTSNNAVSNQRNNVPIALGPIPRVDNPGDWKPIRIDPECCKDEKCTNSDFSVQTVECSNFSGETVQEGEIIEYEISNCSSDSCPTCKDKVYTSGSISPCEELITDDDNTADNAMDYYTAKDMKLLDIPGLPPNQIKDITQRGSIIVALEVTMNTLYFVQLFRGKVAKIYKVNSKISLNRIIFFRGDLYAISNGILYCQDPGSIGKKTIYWYKVDGVPENLNWITTTTNDDYLWIQTSENSGQGILYNCKLCSIETSSIANNVIRIYGSCPEQKADINTNNHELYIYSCKHLYQNVGMALYNCSDEILYVRPDVYPNPVKGLRLIKERIYYLLVS